MYHTDLSVHSALDKNPPVVSLESCTDVHSVASVTVLGTAWSGRYWYSEVLQTSQTGEPTRGAHSERMPCWVVGP